MNQQLIRQARVADISRFLLDYHAQDIKVSGASICLKDKPYVCTKMGYCGYVDYHTNETGNSIDLLVRYLNYSFQSAVYALTGNKFTGSKGDSSGALSGMSGLSASQLPSATGMVPNEFVIPAAAAKPFTRVTAYLSSRGIPEDLVLTLINLGLLFQDAVHGNAVFLSRAKDFCEIRGTVDSSTGKGFHGIRRKYPYCFWSLRNFDQPVEVAFICESAIDAISLYFLHSRRNPHIMNQWHEDFRKTAAYVSIGGVANQQTINRISHSVRTVIAVDNDEAGQKCRDQNSSLEFIIPIHKDWNEDLMAERRTELVP